MFVDAVGANVLVFAVGQVFAWLFLRTGRFWVGAGATILLWVSIDWWLVQRYLLATPPQGQQLAVWCLQATAVAVTVSYVWAVIRRRLAAPQRPARFRAAIAELLQGKPKEAEASFAGLVWSNPWDASAWIGRGDSFRRLGVLGKARGCYRRAIGVDATKEFADLLAHRLQLLQAAPRSEELAKNAAAVAKGPAPAATPVARKQKRVRKAVSGN